MATELISEVERINKIVQGLLLFRRSIRLEFIGSQSGAIDQPDIATRP